MSDLHNGPTHIKKIKIFSSEFSQVWPVSVLVCFNPEAGKIKLITKPGDHLLALGMLSYAESKIHEEMNAPKEKSNIVIPGLGLPQLGKM